MTRLAYGIELNRKYPFANINGIQAEESMPSEYSSEENVELPQEEDIEFIETNIKEE